ncbi:DUF2278 family protein [Brevibacillus dissolubilis]|uniref:DUF2278 family protein n=1 Tax=Brevibacillus dissolubilis TaxID=1844116 RepID=UPI001116F3E4|nr:DUF2278 family protein [Brevibacillus dissolubilis]
MVPIYAVYKGKGSTISDIKCETIRRRGQPLDDEIKCKYDRGLTPHYQFRISTGSNNPTEKIKVLINVRSTIEPYPLFCYFADDFKLPADSRFSLETLKALEYGVKVFDYGQKENVGSTIAIDYLRSHLFELDQFKPVVAPGEETTPEEVNLNEALHEYITEAKAKKGDVYIFGDLMPKQSKDISYVDNERERREKLELLQEKGIEGIHDIHMNQGNSDTKEEWLTDNGVYQDGGLLLHFTEEDRWVGIFLRFQSQCTLTDHETGYCTQAADT